ncbi:hypothetical protein UT300018_27720 [Clostridium faecium]|uniref:DEAD/DEAH box helicase family protein n=1 Tax=Clostridium faecium TaxID=2762223 RepID=A0ABR8YUP1_9CLOT|nr:DEAD/DEAH box helicase family protein [Clostridium faecium]MBD8047969.1 DEAD/DEAH box helicase family protein [Clostridium faecium]
MTDLNRLELIIKEIEKQRNRIEYWLPIIEDDFEFQGQQFDDINTLKDFKDTYIGMIAYREQLENKYTQAKSLIKICRDDNTKIAIERFEKEIVDLEGVYEKLEDVLLKKYREENVSDFSISGTKRVARKIGLKIKGIPINPKYIREGFIIEELEDDVDEYVFGIYKENALLNNVDRIFEELEEIVDTLLKEMLLKKEYRKEVYNSYLYKQIDKINAYASEMEYKLDLENEPLYEWQNEAYQAWKKSEYKGTFEVATGCGKTKFALYAIQRIKEQYKDIKIKIIVPTKALMDNWYDSLVQKLHIPTKYIGRRGNNRNEKKREITIYIDKTAQGKFREDFIGTITDNMVGNTNFLNFIVADECHHYESPQNIKIFDKIDYMPKDQETGINYFSIALSATLPSDYDKTGKLRKYLGGTVYTYGFIKALGDGIISPINIVDVSYQLSVDEQKKFYVYKKELAEAEEELAETFSKYNINFNKEGISGLAYYYLKELGDVLNYIGEKKAEFEQQYGEMEWKVNFYEWLYEFAGKNEEIALSVKNYVGKFERLKRLLLNAEDRKKRCIELVKKHIDDKVILFGEYIDDIEEIYLELVNEFGSEKIKLYHSQLDKSIKEKTIESLKLDTTKVICVPTAFDEGVDIPDMSVGVIYQGKRSKRQQVQRLGRIMRKAKGKKSAVMYNLSNPSYGEPKFLNRFIEKQLHLLETMGDSQEKVEKIRKQLSVEFINYNEEIANNNTINELIEKIRI